MSIQFMMTSPELSSPLITIYFKKTLIFWFLSAAFTRLKSYLSGRLFRVSFNFLRCPEAPSFDLFYILFFFFLFLHLIAPVFCTQMI